jgi:acetone monooxygenase
LEHLLTLLPVASSPPWKGVDLFKGTTIHTSRWPQDGFNLDGQRVAVIGTGATGVQTIQEVSQKASHLTVFQRTPNTALPMSNPTQTAATNRSMREGFEEVKKKMQTTFAGFDFEFNTGKAADFSKEEREQLYEQLYHAGE